ncbi:hypothetical protein [Butyrivibrio sp. NC2007]|uniref:hypothetical protein n=1 Tax=Butyrivibrio sp. NC2007 TaxID=1280683 RepID=UPI0003B73F7C|nr:hypothetical protein [Butyrivibrio sp. NC2007]
MIFKSRKLINLIALFSTILLLTGCTGSADSDRTVSVLVTGPNDQTTSSFYRIVKNADEFKYGAIVKMDVNTASDTVVYQPENDRYIYDVVECGDGILFALTRSEKVPEYSLMYLNGDEETRQVFDSEHEMLIENVNGRVIVSDNYTDKYIFDPNTCEITKTEIDAVEENMLNAAYGAVSSMYYSMQDGTVATLQKVFGEDSFTYKVDDKELPIECISGDEFKYVQWGNITDNAGIISGVAAVPVYKNNHRLMEVGLGGLSIEDVSKELLFSLDVTSGKSKVLFETSGERIIGYTNKEVYLYRNSSVYKRNIDSGKEEEIGKISAKRQAQLAFRWIGMKLFVFDKFEGTLITTIQDKTQNEEAIKNPSNNMDAIAKMFPSLEGALETQWEQIK